MDLDFAKINLRMRYPAGQSKEGKDWPAVDELKPLSLLEAGLPTLFTYSSKAEIKPPPERSRPRQETQAAALLLAVQSQDPWRDQWVGFWRDHFSIYGYDGNVGAFLPHWESQVIQKNSFGNFRQFLDATAKHPCMLYYLNNKSSKAGSANENYARELFELHTLGREAYLNDLYAQWRHVPGALSGSPQGYIDQDVYEAARAFTGWTVEDGTSIGGGQNLKQTGQFIYLESWHDNYQKRILATEFNPYAGPQKDGGKVLDLCANHPATAKHLMTKLVKRMISDQPPKALVESAINIFVKNRNDPAQLARISQYLAVQAAQLPGHLRQKVKNPNRLVASFAQAVGLDFSLGEGKIMSPLEAAGPAMYGWVSPEGPPDNLESLLSAGYLRQRLTLLQGVAENWWGTGEWNPFDQLAHRPRLEQLMNRWDKALFGVARPDLWRPLLASQGLDSSSQIGNVKEARRLVGYLTWAPTFQTEAIKPNSDLTS